MAYNQKQNAGRGNMPKTGRDIPLNMMSPAYMTDGPGDKKPGKKPVKKPVEKAVTKKKEDKGFIDTISSAYNNAYTGGKGIVKGKGLTGQGKPGSGSRKGNKDLSVGLGAAVKAGYNYIFGDK
jgi:hypothetical protein